LEAHAEQADDQIDAVKQAYESQDRAGVLSFIHSKHIHTNALFGNHATASEQIAFAVLAGIEFIENTHLSIDDASAQILFHFSVGSELYVEIAKLRAFRAVWSHVMKTGTFEHACSNHAFVKVQTDGFFQAKKDTDNNLIRSTIQAIAACVGGANRIEVLPMEYANTTDVSEQLRWARNIQHLLIEESYFDQYSDLARGSYTLEKLTEDLSTKALETMKEFETSEKLEHFIQTKKEERSLQHALRVVVGENKYVQS
jgi:methylmalonyl-CoA mutase